MRRKGLASLFVAVLASGAWPACAFEPDPLLLQPENAFATANRVPPASETPGVAASAAPAPMAPTAPARGSAASVAAEMPPPAVASASPASAERRALSGVVTSAGQPHSGAVVYLEDAPVEPGVRASALVNQRNMAFIPYVSALAVGGTLTLLNEDPFPHNVYSPDGERFNLGLVSHGVKRTRTFKRAGVYRLLCNMHPPMFAYVVVAPSSYFAVTDRHGQFAIQRIPEGTYTVALWAPGKLSAEKQTVTLAGADATIAFALHK